jgi:hypothetical protein
MRWLKAKRFESSFVQSIALLCVMSAEAPAADRYAGLVGAKVTQKRGIVCTTPDCVVYGTPDKGADHGWRLDYERAVGVVKEIDREGRAIVEFATPAGWSQYRLGEKATLVRDYWNEEFIIIHKAESEIFNPKDNGLLLSGEDAAGQLIVPVRVSFPLSCISFPPPKFGDRVVRGPDWNKGTADGEPGFKGTIIRRSPLDPSPRGRDGYVTVEWDATRRKGRYRWDYLRKFDVIPANIAEPSSGEVEMTAEAADSSVPPSAGGVGAGEGQNRGATPSP